MEQLRRKRVGVLVGGHAAEREVSRASAEAVLSALRERGHTAIPIHVDRDLDLLLRQERVEIAFLAALGRDAHGAIQGLLETLGVPFTGSSCVAAALASDKLRAKELFRLHNLPTPTYYRHCRDLGTAAEQHHAFGFPCVVKPRRGGSGLGVTLARDLDELEAAVEAALAWDDELLVERYVAGVEVQVAILDGELLGVAEMVTGGTLLDFAARHLPERNQVVIPPRLGVERLRGVVTQALRAHHLLGCRGLSRVDMVVSERGNESILEVDVLPDLSPGSLAPKLAHAAGLEFPDLVERLLAAACVPRARGLSGRADEPASWNLADRRAGSAAGHH